MSDVQGQLRIQKVCGRHYIRRKYSVIGTICVQISVSRAVLYFFLCCVN